MYVEDSGHPEYWLRKRDFEQFRSKSSYTAWVVGALARPKSGSAGISAAGWYIARDDNKELPCRYVRVSPEAQSDEQRAAVAAVLRVLEAVPSGSTLRILTKLSWLVPALNGDIRAWKANGYRNPKALAKKSKKRNGWEIYDEIIKLISEKKISLSAEEAPSSDHIPKKLTAWANQCARKAQNDAKIKLGQRQEYRRGNPRTSSTSE